MMQRRSLILGALAAPFVARVPGLLMPVKPVRDSPPIVRVNLDLRPCDPAPGDFYRDARGVLWVRAGGEWAWWVPLGGVAA